MEVFVGDPLSPVTAGSAPSTDSGDLAHNFSLGGITGTGAGALDMAIPWFSTTGVTTSQAQDWVDATKRFFP